MSQKMIVLQERNSDSDSVNIKTVWTTKRQKTTLVIDSDKKSENETYSSAGEDITGVSRLTTECDNLQMLVKEQN